MRTEPEYYAFGPRHSGKIGFLLIVAVAVWLLGGCSPSHYRRSADKEVYGIVQEKQRVALGQTNAFTIDTPYSPRKPDDIKADEIIADRMRETKEVLTLPEALRIAVSQNRDYQLRKEDLYFSALALTAERFEYVPQFFNATPDTSVVGTRNENDDKSLGVANRASLDKLFKTGGSVGLDLANDLLTFYSGGRSDSTALSTIALSLAQPLLRGAGAKIAAENLTQAERNVIYEIRDFSYYQDDFALGIVATYLGLLGQQDTVKNQYENYLSRVALRERAVAWAVDRLAPFQADMAAQEELTARDQYILAVQGYRTSLDNFKITLGLPVGYDIRLDETVLKDLEEIGLMPVPLTNEEAYNLVLTRRPDLLNEIDRFEDSKRKIVVAADRLKPDLVVFANASLNSEPPTDYAKFDFSEYRLSGGLRLDLPFNRKLERNNYRLSLINFEVQLRRLARFLDDLKRNLRDHVRTLERSLQTYDIQTRAKQLADRRVESSELSLQAGRVQVRDVADAQTARVEAYNRATVALVQYHLTRMRLLLHLGILKTAKEKFWLDYGDVPKASAVPAKPAAAELITPDELFKNDKQ